MSDTVTIKINNQELVVPKNYTVLQAARMANVNIPTLCYLEGINAIGACRMCIVEIKGSRSYQAACVYPVSEGLEISTATPDLLEARKVTLELILSNHDRKCLTCVRNQNCELQKLADEFHIDEIRFLGENKEEDLDDASPAIVRDNNKCILCRRCVAACGNMQSVSVIQAKERGFNTNIGCAFDMPLNDVPCVNCGQCIISCPVGALYEKDNIKDVLAAIKNKDLHVVVQTAPAVRAALGEEFGFEIGTPVTGKMVAALKRMGFDKIFDTDTAADLTIMEEGTEFIERFTSGKNLPLITSCSPGWVKFCEQFYPEFIDNLSTAKSPQAMMGAILKSYYAEKNKIDPSKIIVVSVMPCTAKKFEIGREELKGTGFPDVDIAITTRELAKMIKMYSIDFRNLADEQFDNPFGAASGAGVIFGATGGVMEAALRTVSEVLEKKPLENIDFEMVRGTKGIKVAELEIAGKKVKVAVVSGLKNARKILDEVKKGVKYDFIEIMACPGGCVNGGGQPIRSATFRMKNDLRVGRAKAIYNEDKSLKLRKSHENPVVQKLYDSYLEKPGSHKAHELLHTHYQVRNVY